MSRRRFLVLTAKGSALVAAATTILRKELLAPAHADAATAAGRTGLLVRPDDQLRLTFELLNLDLDPMTNTLVTIDAANPFAGIVIGFGSQHTVEDPIATGAPVPTAAADHRGAGDSRIVLAVPSGTPYTAEALLGFAAHALVLDDRADPARGTSPTGEPLPDVTALELDESLVFSPTPDGRFVAATVPVTLGDVTELWRARLATVDGLGALSEPKDPGPNLVPTQLRAIWSRPGDPPFERTLDEATRDLLVGATTGTAGVPLSVGRLWLTSAGAFTELTGVFSTGLLASFHQRGVTGRDLVVEVVERGYLAPFGHEATITRVTQRDLRIDDGGGVTDVLVQDDYLTVAAPTRVYDSVHMPDGRRAFPFTAVTVTGAGAGPVGKAQVTLSDGSSIGLDRAWVITSDRVDLALTYEARDKVGDGGITFLLPAVFVAESSAYAVQDTVNGQITVLGRLAQYFAEAPDERRRLLLGGQTMTWAEPPSGGSTPAGSRLATASARLVLDRPAFDPADAATVRDNLEATRTPAFFPRVADATVADPALSSMLGGTTGEVEVIWADRWLTDGTGAGNPDLAYFTLPSAGTLARTGSGQGLLTPTFAFDGFSQAVGPGSQLPVDANGNLTWDPAQALGDGATLLGNLLLRDLVELVNTSLDGLEGEKGLPTFEVVVEEGDNDFDPPKSISFVLAWQPKLKPFPASNPVFLTTDVIDPGIFDDPTTAALELTYVVPFDGADTAGFDVELGLDNFGLRLPPVKSALELYFGRLHFLQPHDGNADLDTTLQDWRFVDVLGWLDPVRQFVLTVLDLFDLDVNDDGVHLDVDVPIPSFSIGVVGVTRVSIGFALDIPNDGGTTIDFNLSSRDDPFAVTVFGFGGSGSLELELSSQELVFLEVSTAITYELGVSFVLGSASLSASLGLDVLYEKVPDDAVTLTAFVELRGNVSLLGIVNVTGKVTVSLSYNLTSKVLHGSAKVVGEVETPFGKSEASTEAVVDIPLGDRAAAAARARRTTSQSRLAAALAEPDPLLSFADRFDADEWTTYCTAFS